MILTLIFYPQESLSSLDHLKKKDRGPLQENSLRGQKTHRAQSQIQADLCWLFADALPPPSPSHPSPPRSHPHPLSVFLLTLFLWIFLLAFFLAVFLSCSLSFCLSLLLSFYLSLCLSLSLSLCISVSPPVTLPLPPSLENKAVEAADCLWKCRWLQEIAEHRSDPHVRPLAWACRAIPGAHMRGSCLNRWICENLRFCAEICVLGLVCHLRSVRTMQAHLGQDPSRPNLFDNPFWTMLHALTSQEWC